MKRVVILTGSDLRHTFFRKYIAKESNIEVVASFCEGMERCMPSVVEKEADNVLRKKHLIAREQSERDFFGSFVENVTDNSNPVSLHRGEINSQRYVDRITDCGPDLLIAYGCSLIKDPLISAFKGCFLNVHLGLSPYYRGSGTNYWPLVNGEPEYVGATFMHINVGIDTGEIIHQIRARFVWGDMPVCIGNRLIIEMAKVYRDIIVNFERLKKMKQFKEHTTEKYYEKKDFSEKSVETLYKNFKEGLMEKYIYEERERCNKVPIIINPVIGVY